MRKLFAGLMALSMPLMSLPAQATLVNSNVATRSGSTDFYQALITATGPDTTENADSNTITNLDNSVVAISAGVKATGQTGTSPTLTVSLIGSYDNATWFTLQSRQASTAGTTANMATAALGISTASTTAVSAGISTAQFDRNGDFPPYLRVRVTVGGTSTPGWTGVAYALVTRSRR